MHFPHIQNEETSFQTAQNLRKGPELVCGKVWDHPNIIAPKGARKCLLEADGAWGKHRFWGPIVVNSNVCDFGQVTYLL